MKPYTISKYPSKEDLRNAIMVADNINDTERLSMIFNLVCDESKERIKAISPELYYCILAVIDTYKTHPEKLISYQNTK